jgi:hypothetical protein
MKANPLDMAVAIALEAYGPNSTSTMILTFVSLNKGIDQDKLADFVASSTATTTAAALVAGPFASAVDAVKSAITSAASAVAAVAQVGIRELGLAVHSTLGIFDTLISQTITAEVLNVQTVNAKTLCLDGLCVDKTQLQNLLNGTGGSGGGNGGGGNSGGGEGGNGSTTPDTEAPVISLNGNNPAEVTVGSSYTDLGATVTDNVDDNLGFKVSLNGGPQIDISELSVDTASTTTHTIVFTAIDTAGNIGTATRTVNVVAQ